MNTILNSALRRIEWVCRRNILAAEKDQNNAAQSKGCSMMAHDVLRETKSIRRERRGVVIRERNLEAGQ